jgi:predicted nucleic-acid-binding protein
VIALDTSVVVRFLVNDDPAQGRRARELIGENETFIATTVLLECEWVLRSAYGMTTEDIGRLFRGLLGLISVRTESPARILRALEAFDSGLDFAGALHLAHSDVADSFASFDRTLVRRTRNLGLGDVIAL